MGPGSLIWEIPGNTMTYPKCGHENPAEARFCSSCGSPLSDEADSLPEGLPGGHHGGISSRDLGGLIGETFKMYRRSFWPFVLIALVPQVPFFISGYTPLPLTLLLVLVGIVLGFLQAGAFVCGVVGEIVSNSVDVVECYRAAWRKALSLIGAFILILLALVIPLILSVVITGLPLLLFLLVIWFFVTETIMVEGKGPIQALGRSRELVKGTWWRVFGIAVVFVLMSFGLFVVGAIPAAIIGFFSSSVGGVLFTAVSILVVPIFSIARTLLYLDLRVRKESYTGQALASEVGAPR